MIKLVFSIIIIASFFFNCKEKEQASENQVLIDHVPNKKNQPINFSQIEAKIEISPGSIFIPSDTKESFDSLPDFDIKNLFLDFRDNLDNETRPRVRINGLEKDIITVNDFQARSIGFSVYLNENGKPSYTLSLISTVVNVEDGGHSNGEIQKIRCSIYTAEFKRCKFYLKNILDKEWHIPMKWVILNVKDNALFMIENDVGIGILGYQILDEKYRSIYLANFKKAFKVAINDPNIGFRDDQIKEFTLEELDLLTDGLATKVKAEQLEGNK